MLESILRFLRNYREIIVYGIVGCVSVFTTIAWFWFFAAPLGLPHMLANALGWVADVWTDFIMNKYIVFRTTRGFWREAWKFISARGLSGLLDMGLLYIFADIIKLSVSVSKGICIVIIIVVNYIVAKVFVFYKRSDHHSKTNG